MIFKINGIEAEVSPLTMNSLAELTKMLYTAKGEFIGFTKLFEKVNPFMKNIVFRNNADVKDIDFGEIDYELFDEILAFFLTKNPTAKKRLLELAKSLGIDQTNLTAGL